MNKSENLQEQRRKFSCVQLYKEASTFSQQATCWFPDITNKEHSSSCLDYETAPSSHTQQQEIVYQVTKSLINMNINSLYLYMLDVLFTAIYAFLDLCTCYLGFLKHDNNFGSKMELNMRIYKFRSLSFLLFGMGGIGKNHYFGLNIIWYNEKIKLFKTGCQRLVNVAGASGGQGNKDYHDEWKQKFGEDVNTLREIGNERWMPMRVNDEDDNMDNTGGNREQLYFQEDRAENSTSASLQWDDEERNYNSDTNSQSLFRNTRSPTPLNDERDDRVYQSSGVHPNLSNPSRSPSNRQDDEEELVNNPLGDNGTSKDKNILKPSEERRLRKDISESRDDDDDDPCFFNFESEEILFLEAGQDRRAETDEGEREKPECQSEISQERDETPAAEAGSNHGGVEAAGEEG
ncbi:hypothetical protein LINPERHAP1_LOCUS27594 [Linum perenne]